MRRLLLVLVVLASVVPASQVAAISQPHGVYIDLIAPRSAERGDFVVMIGRGFGGPSVKVAVGSAPARVLLSFGRILIFRVPDNAPTGKVRVGVTNRYQRTATIGFEVIGAGFDGTATPLVDPSRATSALIGPDGGTLSVGGLTLAIPAGALVETTSITMTPMTGLQGTPFAQFVAGAVFEPAGLQFINPAILTLPLPAGVSVEEAASFVMQVTQGQGSGFHLVPYQATGSTLSIIIPHFSAAGAVAADPTELAEALSYEPSPADERANQAIAAIGERWERGQITDAERDAAIDTALRDWYRTIRTGWTTATGASMEFFELAAADWFAWRARIRVYGRDSSFTAELAESTTLAHDAALNLVQRLLSRCTGTGDPFAPLTDILRFATYVEMDPATFDFSAEHPEWGSGQGLVFSCMSIVVESFDAPPMLASGYDNTFEASAYIDFFNGPDRRDIGLIYELYRYEPLGNVLEGSVTTATGQMSLPILVSNEQPNRSYTLEITLEAARATGSDVLRSLTVTDSLTRPVRERIALAGRRPTDTSYLDTFTGVRAGEEVSIRVQVAGDGMETVTVTFGLEGSGSISDTSMAVDPAGEATITYTAPESTGGHVCVIATIPEPNGTPTEDRLCFDIISANLVYVGTVVQSIDQPSHTTCNEDDLCQTRNGSLTDTFNVRLELQPNGTFTATGTMTHEMFDEFTTDVSPEETCHSIHRETGAGEITGYSGTLISPVGFLTARYTATRTNEIGPCRGQPANTTTQTQVSTSTLGTFYVEPVYEGDLLVAIVWSYTENDQSTNTSYAVTGQVDLVR